MQTMRSLEEIDIRELNGFLIGHASDAAAATGCTVILSHAGATAGVDVRGGGPASRELALLEPHNMIQAIHAVLLAGGSAYGLDAAAGVMAYLEEQDCGFDVGCGKVPIVCGAALFDLQVGESSLRPNKEMGYAACLDAASGLHAAENGNIGAGTGATVGKLAGPARSCKSGLGCYAVRYGALQVAAVIAVNALGDIYDLQSGRIIAGLRSVDGRTLANSGDVMLSGAGTTAASNPFTTNTTIGCILTNAKLSKPEAHKVACVAHDGIARVIFPVHTQADGDTMFCLADGKSEAPVDLVASIAAEVTSRAIMHAVRAAKPAYGLPAACSFPD